MDITKAIIAGIATITSAIITVLLKEYLGRRKENYRKQSDERRKKISGRWNGKYQQVFEGNEVTIQINIELKVLSRGAINGIGNVSYGRYSFQVNIKGGFYLDDFLKLEYENSDKGIIQFGSFVLKLSSNAKEIKGHFVGYGHITEAIISGPVSLSKE